MEPEQSTADSILYGVLTMAADSNRRHAMLLPLPVLQMHRLIKLLQSALAGAVACNCTSRQAQAAVHSSPVCTLQESRQAIHGFQYLKPVVPAASLSLLQAPLPQATASTNRRSKPLSKVLSISAGEGRLRHIMSKQVAAGRPDGDLLIVCTADTACQLGQPISVETIEKSQA